MRPSLLTLLLLLGACPRERGGDSATDSDACALCSDAGAATGAGLGSQAPGGCDGGAATLAWSEVIVEDAGKSVPIAADLDDDGAVDIAINPRVTVSAAVFPGRGDGTFDDRVLLPSGGPFAGGWGIDLGDLGGDPLLDLAAGDHASGGLAWINDGSFAFSLAASGLPTQTLQGAGLVDLDGDGHLDVVLGSDQFGSGFAVRHGDGEGGWSDRGVEGIPALGAGDTANNGWFAAGDLDADGDLDLVAFGQRSGTLVGQVFLNAGDGLRFDDVAVLAADASGSVGNPVQGGVGDLDCDGTLDVAVGGTVWLGDGTGGFTQGAVVAGSLIGQLGDLDGDGDLDLVTHDAGDGLRAWANDGTGTGFELLDLGLPDAQWESPVLAGETVTTPLATPYGIDVVDLDGNGVLDVLRVHTATVSDGWSGGTVAIIEAWVR